jgi:hypothetical protein
MTRSLRDNCESGATRQWRLRRRPVPTDSVVIPAPVGSETCRHLDLVLSAGRFSDPMSVLTLLRRFHSSALDRWDAREFVVHSFGRLVSIVRFRL